MNEKVLVSIPYFKCQKTVRRAVNTMLRQTHKETYVLVVDDGDGTAGAALEGIAGHDRRLFVCKLPENRGRYFADSVALMASPFPWFSVHDADDYSDDDRIERLFARQRETGAYAVFSEQRIHRLDGTTYIEDCERVDGELSENLQHLVHHAGIYNREALLRVGGYRPDFRVGYDSLIVNLLKMAFKIDGVRRPLYHRVARAGSLTSDRATGFGSPHREQAKKHIIELYDRCMKSDRKPETIAKIVLDDVPTNVLEEVERYADDLREALPW